MEGTSKTRSLMMMAAMAGMVGAISAGPQMVMRMGRRELHRVMSSTYRNSFERNAPSGAPVGTYWRGDGVLPAGETRQMRRARERAEAKKSGRG